jgi:predicted nuclease of predicted toxin-antitoxin system
MSRDGTAERSCLRGQPSLVTWLALCVRLVSDHKLLERSCLRGQPSLVTWLALWVRLVSDHKLLEHSCLRGQPSLVTWLALCVRLVSNHKLLEHSCLRGLVTWLALCVRLVSDHKLLEHICLRGKPSLVTWLALCVRLVSNHKLLGRKWVPQSSRHIFRLTFWQTRLPCSGASAFDEELDIMTRAQTRHHVRVEHGTVHGVPPALNGVHSPLDEKCPEPSQQPSETLNVHSSRAVRPWRVNVTIARGTYFMTVY